MILLIQSLIEIYGDNETFKREWSLHNQYNHNHNCSYNDDTNNNITLFMLHTTIDIIA
jgi:hypothetical protein